MVLFGVFLRYFARLYTIIGYLRMGNENITIETLSDKITFELRMVTKIKVTINEIMNEASWGRIPFRLQGYNNRITIYYNNNRYKYEFLLETISQARQMEKITKMYEELKIPFNYRTNIELHPPRHYSWYDK